MGQFTATISANGKHSETIIYATKKSLKSLMCKYTAFDLSTLHINVKNQQVLINLHNIDVSEDYDQDLHTLHIQDVQHIEYSQMAKHLTSEEISKAFPQKISDLLQEGQLCYIKVIF